MKICTVYFNCHGYQIKQQLEVIKSYQDIYETFYISINRIITDERAGFTDLEISYLKKSDLIIYQYIETDRGFLNHENVLSYVPETCIKISLPHFRSSIYHLISYNELTLVKNWDNAGLMRQEIDLIGHKVRKWEDLVESAWEEFKKMENHADVKMLDYVQANYQKVRLFQSRSYPTDQFFNELAKRIAIYLGLPLDNTPIKKNFFAWAQVAPIFPQVAKNLMLEFDWFTMAYFDKGNIEKRFNVYNYFWAMHKTERQFPGNLLEISNLSDELWAQMHISPDRSNLTFVNEDYSNFGQHYPLFDATYYIDQYRDLREAGITNKKDAQSHYINYGRFENRLTNAAHTDQRLIIIIIGDNIQDVYYNLLTSIQFQSVYADEVHIFDNVSEDHSEIMSNDLMKNFPTAYYFHRSEEKTNEVQHIKRIVTYLKTRNDKETIVCWIDGHGHFIDSDAISQIKDIYCETNCKFAYGTNSAGKNKLVWEDYVSLRQQKRNFHLPITFKLDIIGAFRDTIFWNNVQKRDYYSGGHYLLVYEAMEIAGYGYIKRLNNPLYFLQNITIEEDLKDIRSISETLPNAAFYGSYLTEACNKIGYLEPMESHSVAMRLCPHSVYWLRIKNLTAGLTFKMTCDGNILTWRGLNKNMILYTNSHTEYEISLWNWKKEDIKKISNMHFKMEYLSSYNNDLRYSLTEDYQDASIYLNVLPQPEGIRSETNTKLHNSYYLVFGDLLSCQYLDEMGMPYMFFSQSKLDPISIEHLTDIFRCRFENGIVYDNGKVMPDNLPNILQNYVERDQKAQEKEQKIHISLATYPKRSELVAKTLLTLIKQDTKMGIKISLYANSYNYALMQQLQKKLTDELSSFNVEFSYVIDTLGTLRAAGKFFWSRGASENTVNFICDDDIIYPPDYISHSLKNYQEGSICSYLGVIFPEIITKFPVNSNRKRNIKFTDALDSLVRVHLVGSGVMFYSGNNLPDFNNFLQYVTYNDDTLAILSKKANIPLIAVPKVSNWLESQKEMGIGLYEEKAYDPTTQVILKLYIENNPWPNFE